MNKTKTNKSIFVVFILIMVFGLGLIVFDKYLSGSGSDREVIGEFTSTTGTVEYKEDTYSSWSGVKQKRDVVNQSTVFTHENAKANLNIEGVQVAINENSLVKIERPNGVKTLDMSFGSLIFDSKSKQSIVLRINNKDMVVNLNDSRVKIIQDKGSDKLKVISLRGDVEVKEKNGTPAAQIIKQDQELDFATAPPIRKEEFKIVSPANNGRIYLGKKNKEIKILATDVITSLKIEDLSTGDVTDKPFMSKSRDVSVEVPAGQYRITAKTEDGREAVPVVVTLENQKGLNISYRKESYKASPTQIAPKVTVSRNLKQGAQVYVKKTEDVNWTPVYDDEWRPNEPGNYELVLVQEEHQDFEAESERSVVQITEDDFKTIKQPQMRIAKVEPEPEPVPEPVLKSEPLPAPKPKRKRAPASQVESQMQVVEIGDRKNKFSLGSRFLQQTASQTSSFGSATYEAVLTQGFFINYERRLTDTMHVYSGFDYNPVSVSVVTPAGQSKQSYDRKVLNIGAGYSLTRWFDLVIGTQGSIGSLVYDAGVAGAQLLKMDTLKVLMGANFNFNLASRQYLRIRANVAPTGIFLGKASEMQNLSMQMQYLAGIEYSYLLKSNL
ncbi:MAG: hypothetical protein K2Q26_03350, partial [Bdellovibrionales bacterium]|nr:hypothetical protein [Bdellovibrionales bacterium]